MKFQLCVLFDLPLVKSIGSLSMTTLKTIKKMSSGEGYGYEGNKMCRVYTGFMNLSQHIVVLENNNCLTFY